MDDFEYSLHISDQDWDSFFQECEGCNLLSPGLASREDSGMSDIDEMGCHFLDMNRHSKITSTEPDLQIDGPPDCEGSPVDSYLSKYGIRSPEQVLSGSEEDLHLQTVNLFFEQLKCVTENEQPFVEVNCRSEKINHLDGFTDKQVICPSGRNESNPKGEITKRGEADTWGSTALEEGTIPTSTNAQVNASASTAKELVIGEESFSLKLITVGVKQEQQEKRCDLSTELKLKPETKPPDKHKMLPVVAANGIDMTDSKPAKENIAQLDPGSSSDSKDSLVSQIPVSPSNLRRKRRKKKRMSIEAGEPGPGYEAQFRVHQSESEEERFIQREEINNFPTNVKKTERPSLPRFKISPMPHNSENLKLNFTFAPADLKCSKSLPVSFTTFGSEIGIHNICKSMNDMSLVNNGQLKVEVCTKSILPQIDKVLHLQESDTGLNIIHSDTDCSPAQSKTSMRKTLSEPVSDHSAAGCQRKSLLSPNISSAADSTEPLSSFNLTEDTYKDVSCLGNENDCCALKSEENLPGKWNMTMNLDFQQSGSSLTKNIDELKFSLDGNSPQIFSQCTLQKCERDTVDVSGCKTFKISKDSPLSKTNLETECCMPESAVVSDYRKDEDHIQNMNNNSEEINVNASIMSPGNLTASSEDKKDIVNEDDRRDESNDEHLLRDETTGSSEHIHGHKEEGEMLNENSFFENVLADVSEMNPAIVAERQTFSCSPEFSNVSNDPESIVLDTPGPVRSPVYAISSFWNEMEKLTINDILRLRMISNAQHPSVLTQPEDGSVADTTDAADSGYFTQPDDSKPDRLSGDMSFISDLDEDLAQLQTQYSSKLDDESCEFPSRSCSVTWENDSDPLIMGDDVVYIGSETTPEHVYATNAQQCFKKMCKNVSVQNLQALESHPIRQMLRNASLQSIHSEVEDPFYHVNTSHQTCLSDDEDVEGGGITFSEIVNFFFADDEPERCSSRADNNTAASCLDGTGTSVPEMYDHFFSEFDSESFFNPFEDETGGNDKTVPIFSCTRSVNRNLQFPEAYDYFFPDSPVNSDEDDENDNAPIKMLTRYDHTSSNHYSVATTDMYEYFYPDDTFQSNPLSLIQHADPAVPEEKSSSWALTHVKPFHKGIQSVTVMGPDDKPFPDTLYLNLENRIFQQLAEQQKKCMEMPTVVADPRLDAPFLPLRQADMCLVCIAFASWVLKSASPGADTWKAALLANISALSAIRYLRRHKREEVSGKTPLRQIEPA